MFFILSKTIGYLCYPLTLVFLGLLLFVILHKRRPRAARWCFGLGVSLLWFCCCPTGQDALIRPLEDSYKDVPLPARVDAIVVLGGALNLGLSRIGRPVHNQAADRFIYGTLLARQHPNAKLVFSGGTAALRGSSHTEAPILKAEAVAFGVPPERIIAEDKSRDTYENAVETARLLGPGYRGSIVLVTSAFHMKRSVGVFKKLGLKVTPFAVDFRNHGGGRLILNPLPQAYCLENSTAAVREYFGLLMYKLRGYL